MPLRVIEGMNQVMVGDQVLLFNKRIMKPIITYLRRHHLFTPVAITTLEGELPDIPFLKRIAANDIRKHL